MIKKFMKARLITKISIIIGICMILGYGYYCTKVDWTGPSDPNTRAIKRIYDRDHKEQREKDDGKMTFHNYMF